ncbi:MAG: hypothetical protein LBB65_01310 [Burkholderiales bacterium]|nr:hypothetical protein [Burkholderiales bacterium]
MPSSLDDIDGSATAGQAFDAATAYLESLGVDFDGGRPHKGATSFSEYLYINPPEGSAAAREGETLKLRFADHGNQSGLHTPTDHNWVEGHAYRGELSDMLNAAVDFSRGIKGVGEKLFFQSAWHGSPHEFERFMLDHIGIGEGAQAYGWGLYFAGNKDVAEHYRKKLNSGLGKLYEVNIPENHELLDWDNKPSPEHLKAIAEQAAREGYDDHSIAYRNEKGDLVLNGSTGSGEQVYREIAKSFGRYGVDGYAGRIPDEQAASEFLNRAGIKGIRYLDGSSRSKGEGSHNFVIFDDKSIEMLNRFYQSSTGDAHQIVERATPERKAAMLAEARERAGTFVGKQITNADSGFVGVVSKRNLAKMTSDSAIKKSESLESHLLAVANVDKLFENATLDHSHPDSKGELTISAIHRFVSPMIGVNDSLCRVGSCNVFGVGFYCRNLPIIA